MSTATTTSPMLCACGHPWGAHRRLLGTCKDSRCACSPKCTVCGAGWRDQCTTPTGRRHGAHPRVAARRARALQREAEEAARVQFLAEQRRWLEDMMRRADERTAEFNRKVETIRLAASLTPFRILVAFGELGLNALEKPTEDQVRTAFREKVRTIHPDSGGSGDGAAMASLTKARDIALISLGVA